VLGSGWPFLAASQGNRELGERSCASEEGLQVQQWAVSGSICDRMNHSKHIPVDPGASRVGTDVDLH